MKQQLVKKYILGIGVTDANRDNVLEYLFGVLEHSDQKLSIMTPNPEIVMHAATHESYRNILNTASISLCDGVGLFMAAGLLGTPLKQRISGVDFMELLCRKSAEKGVTVGFLGGRNGVAEKAAECLTKQYPGLNVVFTGEEWPVEPKGKSIKNKGKKNTEHSSAPLYIPPYTYPDILFVAYGFPKQEEWIAEHLEKLPVRVMMGVGGSFDYLSGEVSRAPLFLRRMGLEWLYRLFHQPWRLKRQLVLPKFILLVLKQRFFTRRTSYVN